MDDVKRFEVEETLKVTNPEGKVTIEVILLAKEMKKTDMLIRQKRRLEDILQMVNAQLSEEKESV